MSAIAIDLEKEQERSKLKGSLHEFIKFFTKYITNRNYIESRPAGRESHQIIICRELTQLLRQDHTDNLSINIAPGTGKSLHLCMFVAWAFTHYPDCRFIYVSYSQTLASTKTAFIKQIMSSPIYQFLFDVKIAKDSKAKEHFSTTDGGEVAAFGSAGSITGRDAGLPGLDRFSGAVIIDDAHKPNEVHSDTIREKVIQNYEETIRERTRGHNVPIINVGQRLHEDDLTSFMLSSRDTKYYRSIILKSLDQAGNELYPEVHTKEMLLDLQNKSPYVFASQHQHDPMPAGGGLYKRDDFVILDETPEIYKTFITADTAETNKTYNDATVFSFWGLYDIENYGKKTGMVGLHWLDCVEIRIEPRELEEAFVDFYQNCLLFNMQPSYAAVEKKSTGVTLVSVIRDNVRGLVVKDINRGRGNSKTNRMIEAQHYIGSKLVSFTKDAHHIDMCIDHMAKITANDTHKHDDIADTCIDAVNIALLDNKTNKDSKDKREKVLNNLNKSLMTRLNAGAKHGR